MKSVVLYLSAFAAMAAVGMTETVDDVEWSYVVSAGEAKISSGADFTPAIPAATAGGIEVPATLGGSPVTVLGICSFIGCSGLASVALPTGLKSVEAYAFSGCTGLTAVEIPAGVTNIGACAFTECSALTEVRIPGSVSKIGNLVFADCGALKTVYVDDAAEVVRVRGMLEVAMMGIDISTVAIKVRGSGAEAAVIVSAGFAANGRFEIAFTGTAGAEYVLETATSLDAPVDWRPVAGMDPIAATGSVQAVGIETAGYTGFYRLVVR